MGVVVSSRVREWVRCGEIGGSKFSEFIWCISWFFGKRFEDFEGKNFFLSFWE